MASDVSPPAGVVARKLVLTVVGVFLFAAGLTLLWEGMRAVMDVGGFCASGGPYQIRQACPDGTGLVFVGIVAGLVGTGLVVAGTFRGGPHLWTLAWPALFLALGWNFAQYGVDPPPPESGPVWGWIICAILFLAMGAIPLIGILWNARLALWGDDEGPAATPLQAMANLRPTPVAPFGSTTIASAPASSATAPAPRSGPGGPPPDRALVADLERLADLHRRGSLTDDEFARAKAARLAEEDR